MDSMMDLLELPNDICLGLWMFTNIGCESCALSERKFIHSIHTFQFECNSEMEHDSNSCKYITFPKKNRLYCVLSPKTMQLMYKSEVLWMNLIQCIDSIYSQTMNHECLKSRRKNWQQRRWPGRFGNTGAGANILMGSNSTFYSSKIRQITRGRLYGEHLFDFFPSNESVIISRFVWFNVRFLFNSFVNMRPATTNWKKRVNHLKRF